MNLVLRLMERYKRAELMRLVLWLPSVLPQVIPILELLLVGLLAHLLSILFLSRLVFRVQRNQREEDHKVHIPSLPILQNVAQFTMFLVQIIKNRKTEPGKSE